MHMASKYSNSEKKIRRALSALDTAVQEWYAEHNPKNKEHYASATILDGDGCHSSRITLNSDPEGTEFVDIQSSKQHYQGDCK